MGSIIWFLIFNIMFIVGLLVLSGILNACGAKASIRDIIIAVFQMMVGALGILLCWSFGVLAVFAVLLGFVQIIIGIIGLIIGIVKTCRQDPVEEDIPFTSIVPAQSVETVVSPKEPSSTVALAKRLPAQKIDGADLVMVEGYSGSMVCPKCSTSQRADRNVCMNCGVRFVHVEEERPEPEERFCPFCGAGLTADQIFCGQCGRRQN